MQARAIFEAAVEVIKERARPSMPEIMIPLIGTKKEFDILKAVIDRVAGEVMTSSGRKIEYSVGTMIELPRAALHAGDIAETRRVLQLRHQRPDADHLRHQPRRRRQLPAGLPAAPASSSTTRS